ncbi:MAG: trypsin-like serine protease [Polyangiaceae bacterium]|nr:trypsin-like serine protease [Polyangiaceae bacterium]
MKIGRNAMAWILAVLNAGAVSCAAAPGSEQTDDEQASSPEDIGTTGQPIIDGTATWERPEVVRVNTLWGMCSGTLIGGNTVLTAAHCYNYCKDKGLYSAVGNDNIVVYDRSGNPTTYQVSMALCQGSAVGWDDLAWVDLQRTVTGVTPSTVASTYPPFPYARTVVGFGNNQCSMVRSGWFSYVRCTGAGTKRYREYTYSGDSYHYSLKGDSGGPHFSGSLLGNGPVINVVSGDVDYFFWVEDIVADAVRFKTHSDCAVHDFADPTGLNYRALVPSVGWTPSAQNWVYANDPANGIQIQQLNIYTRRAGVQICVTPYIQGGGWQNETCSAWPMVNGYDVANVAVGTYGKRLEAIKIRLANRPSTLNGVYYQVYVNGAWQAVKKDNEIAGTTGTSIPIQSIRMMYY